MPLILDEELVHEAEAAKALGVEKSTLGVWRHLGKGPPYVKIEKLVKYRPSDLRAYVKSRVVHPQGGKERAS
jgi:hypothetical protein